MKTYFAIVLILLVSILLSNYYLEGKAEIEYIDGVKVMNITGEKGGYSFPTWSPDGKKLAYYYYGNIWIMEIGSKGKAITNNSKASGYPLVWADEDIIYYIDSDAFKEFGKNNELHQLELKENSGSILLENLPNITGISINPINPKEFVIGFHPFQEKNNIYFLNIESGEINKVISNGFAPKWSPNGKQIVYDGPDGIYLYDVTSGESKNIYMYKEGEMINCFSWSPDSQWIAYRKTGKGIFVIAADGNTPSEQILNSGVAELEWSPNGDKIVFTSIPAPFTNEMYIMDVPEKFQSK